MRSANKFKGPAHLKAVKSWAGLYLIQLLTRLCYSFAQFFFSFFLLRWVLEQWRTKPLAESSNIVFYSNPTSPKHLEKKKNRHKKSAHFCFTRTSASKPLKPSAHQSLSRSCLFMAFVRHSCHKGGGRDTLLRCPFSLSLSLCLCVCASELKWILNQCLRREMSRGGPGHRLLTISHIFIHRFTFSEKLSRLAALHPAFPSPPRPTQPTVNPRHPTWMTREGLDKFF